MWVGGCVFTCESCDVIGKTFKRNGILYYLLSSYVSIEPDSMLLYLRIFIKRCH